MDRYDIVISNCLILKPDFSIRKNSTICIKNGRIEKIEFNKEKRDEYITNILVEGHSKLAIPGLVDAHTHSTQQLLRGFLGNEGPLIWPRNIFTFESFLIPEDVYFGAKLFCVESLKAGITTLGGT